MEDDPFMAIWCQPSYGRRRCLVEWTLPEAERQGSVFVYRSETGTAPWTCLNPDAPVAATGNFEDEEFVIDNRVRLVYYRLALRRLDGTMLGSRIIHLLQTLNKTEYGVARGLLKRELEWMQNSRNGIQVYHLVTLAPTHADPRTGQALAAPCPGGIPGGYGAPVRTWISTGPTQITTKDSPDGTGSVSTHMCTARMLNYPRPLRGHLIIDPMSDDRFVVGETVDIFRFRGIVAIAHSVQLSLLGRDDARYRIPVPPL